MKCGINFEYLRWLRSFEVDNKTAFIWYALVIGRYDVWNRGLQALNNTLNADMRFTRKVIVDLLKHDVIVKTKNTSGYVSLKLNREHLKPTRQWRIKQPALIPDWLIHTRHESFTSRALPDKVAAKKLMYLMIRVFSTRTNPYDQLDGRETVRYYTAGAIRLGIDCALHANDQVAKRTANRSLTEMIDARMIECYVAKRGIRMFTANDAFMKARNDEYQEVIERKYAERNER